MSHDPGDAEISTWLRARAVRLDAVEPGSGFADLDRCAPAWGGVRVLGLGESTHGTGEFFTLKHRLLEFLVARMDLRTLAMEASESASVAVDDYVRTGRGDAATVLAGLRFWTWNTREMLAVIEWLRWHNAALPMERRVRFVGVDPQRPESAIADIRQFLMRAAPADVGRFGEALDALQAHAFAHAAPLAAEVRGRTGEIRALVGASRAVGSDDEHARLLRAADHLERSAELATAPLDPSLDGSYYAVRDRLMADAVAAAAEPFGDHRGVPVALWAHNGHLSAGRPGHVPTPMGAHLRSRFGSSYYALALLQGGGSFRARRKRIVGGVTADPVSFRLSAASSRTVEGVLADAVDDDHLVDLRDPHPAAGVAEWLSASGWTRSFGAVVSASHRFAFAPMVPGAEFDGLAYVHRGGPSAVCTSD